MGEVYRARQVSLNRIIAVKMLLAGPLATRDFLQRFRTESAAAASLQHPNIVAIHEVGFAHGQHFFAMDFVEGLTLGSSSPGARCQPGMRQCISGPFLRRSTRSIRAASS